MPQLLAPITSKGTETSPYRPQHNECIKKLIHIFFCSPTINNTDISISAREACLGQTLPLAFKQISAGTHSPRLPWGRDTPVSDHTVLLGSVSFMPAVHVATERQGDAERRGKKGGEQHTSVSTLVSATNVGFSWNRTVRVRIFKLMDEREESER